MGTGFDYVGKRIFLILNSGKVYNGELLEVHDAGDGLVFLTLRDKYNKLVVINSKQIDRLEVEE